MERRQSYLKSRERLYDSISRGILDLADKVVIVNHNMEEILTKGQTLTQFSSVWLDFYQDVSKKNLPESTTKDVT